MKNEKLTITDELIADIENTMEVGTTLEKLTTLEFVSMYFSQHNPRLLNVLVKAARNREDAIVSDKAQELFIENMDKFITKYISDNCPTFRSAHFDDLLQAARLGVILGLEKYDPTIAKPTTFFVNYIKHEVSQYINQFVNGLSTYYANEKYKIKKAISKLEAENREANDMNIAEITGHSTENVKQLRSMITSATSVEFNEVFMNKEDSNDTPEQAILKKELEESIYNSIDKALTETEQQIIKMHYGLVGAGVIRDSKEVVPTKRAFRDISDTLNIPYDKVRKYHASALRKLHTALSKNNIISEPSKSTRILDKECIPIVSAEQGSLILQALESTEILCF